MEIHVNALFVIKRGFNGDRSYGDMVFRAKSVRESHVACVCVHANSRIFDRCNKTFSFNTSEIEVMVVDEDYLRSLVEPNDLDTVTRIKLENTKMRDALEKILKATHPVFSRFSTDVSVLCCDALRD